jgi:geranylgeranyl diphosphate synthase, type II
MSADPVFDLEGWRQARGAVVEGWLKAWASELTARVPAPLAEAMAYALLAGGKRLRPLLVVAAAEACGEDPEGEASGVVRDAACAVEIIHTYSLIHDDLPAIDDDDLRRGRPTCHKVHGEAMAILAGDGLLTDAFGLLAGRAGSDPAEGAIRLRLLARLAAAAGSGGMVGGQALDVARSAVGAGADPVEQVHRLKTGALFAFACAAGAEAAHAPAGDVTRLATFGETVGLAFQIADDLLDETGDAATLGKAVNKDRGRDTATVPRAIGVAAAETRAEALLTEALASIADLGEAAEPLRALARRLVFRRA